MNSDKRDRHATSTGNAMVYILLSLALLATLTMSVMRGGSSGGDDISQDQAELLATQAIAYAGSVKNVVDQMVMSGSIVNNLNFVRPNQSSFDTGSNIHKVYHPAGGGLVLKLSDSKMFDPAITSITAGWYMGRFNNVEWTPTSAQDVVLTAYGIYKPICEQINLKLFGSKTIPDFVTNFSRAITVNQEFHGGGQRPFTAADCPDCNGKPGFCVKAMGAEHYIYYNIISAQ